MADSYALDIGIQSWFVKYIMPKKYDKDYWDQWDEFLHGGGRERLTEKLRDALGLNRSRITPASIRKANSLPKRTKISNIGHRLSEVEIEQLTLSFADTVFKFQGENKLSDQGLELILMACHLNINPSTSRMSAPAESFRDTIESFRDTVDPGSELSTHMMVHLTHTLRESFLLFRDAQNLDDPAIELIASILHYCSIGRQDDEQPIFSPELAPI